MLVGAHEAEVFEGARARLEAIAYRLLGSATDAEAYVRESLRISSATRDRSTIAACLRELGALALARGEFDEARYLLAESYEGMRELGDLMYAGRSRSLLNPWIGAARILDLT